MLARREVVELWRLERAQSTRRRASRVAAGLALIGAGAAVLPADDRRVLMSNLGA